jgi:hypothetical protein
MVVFRNEKRCFEIDDFVILSLARLPQLPSGHPVAASSEITRFTSPISDRSGFAARHRALFGLLNEIFACPGNAQEKPVSVYNSFCHLPSCQPFSCGAMGQ